MTTRFAYTRTGSETSPRVLFLHGFMGSREDWHETFEQIGDAADCLAVDLPGHGGTKCDDDRDFLMPACAEQLHRYLEKMNFLPCRLVGYSMGGRLGLHMILQFPDSFPTAVLESCSPGLKTEEERARRAELDNKRADSLELSSITFFLNDWYVQPMFQGMKKRPDVFQKLLQRRLMGDKKGWIKSLQLMGTGRQPSHWDDLNRLSSKVRLIVGGSDSKFLAIAKQMTAASANFELGVIEKCGHNVHFEAPEKFVAELKSFFGL